MAENSEAFKPRISGFECRRHGSQCRFRLLRLCPFRQKLIAEVLGTYFLIFAGCGAAVVNSDEKGVIITFPGVAIVWGLVVMVMVYSAGHVSGAHFNPAVTIAFATCKRFPWKQAPVYISAQLIGSTLASGTLPAVSNIQSFVLEFVIAFYLMPISGASMNLVRSLGPTIVSNKYKGIGIYIVAPITGAIAGAWVCNIISFTNKPLRETTKTRVFPLELWTQCFQTSK